MRIGEVAAASGVSTDTVRYYERRGLLPRAQRLASGYRVFDDDAVARISLVKSLQGLGMTLEEVVDGLRAVDAGHDACAEEQWRLRVVRQRIDAEIERLSGLQQRIDSVLGGTATECDLARSVEAGTGSAHSDG